MMTYFCLSVPTSRVHAVVPALVIVIENFGNSPAAKDSWFVSARSEMSLELHSTTVVAVGEATGVGVGDALNAENNVQTPEKTKMARTTTIARRRQ